MRFRWIAGSRHGRRAASRHSPQFDQIAPRAVRLSVSSRCAGRCQPKESAAGGTNDVCQGDHGDPCCLRPDGPLRVAVELAGRPHHIEAIMCGRVRKERLRRSEIAGTERTSRRAVAKPTALRPCGACSCPGLLAARTATAGTDRWLGEYLVRLLAGLVAVPCGAAAAG
jgi:hypothetical protein